MQTIRLINADVLDGLKTIESNTIDTIITSPPYWQQRNYQNSKQIGLEPTIHEYVDVILDVTYELMRVLKPSGVFCLNIGDTYFGGGHGATPKYDNGEVDFKDPKFGTGRNEYPVTDWDYSKYKAKCLCGIPERIMLGCIDQGWILRDKIIWAKKVWIAKTNKTTGNAMPSSVVDRCCSTFEYVYMFTKQPKYWSDMDSIRTPYTEPIDRWGGERLHPLNNHNSMWDEGTGQDTYRERSMRPNAMGATSPNVWQINTKPFTSGIEGNDHFAVYPVLLCERLIKAFCPREVCPKCGVARERIVEPTGNRIMMGGYGSKTADHIGAGPTSSLRTKQVIEKHTVGWTSCDCDAGYQPGMVLDPFCGAGTTLLAARDLGRSAIGIEISADYCGIIKKRVGFDQTTIDGSIKYVYEVMV